MREDGGGLAASKDIAQCRIQRKIEHAGQHRFAGLIVQVTVDSVLNDVFVSLFIAEAFTEQQEIPGAKVAGDFAHAGMPGIARPGKVLQQ